MPAARRLAQIDDAGAITETIATAFYNDPFWSWAFADDAERLAQFRVWWRVFVDAAFRNGNPTWVTDNCGSVALWTAPGGVEMTPDDDAELLRLAVELIGGDHGDRVLEVLADFESAHPHDVPHHYLSIVATHDDYRGHGYAEGLLAQYLETVDAEHMPAYLESSNPANLKRYMRLGFEPIGEIFVPDGRPAVTTMWRAER
ncbi:MAG TPA: GNAT family N-acetyltransferase [Acidimicrobiia bacterium]|jgi:GNAT superfamily N-acetyltransferase|nr:GNAT family N-acetyltransferase [Acidimicrobiia bacterium]